MIDLKTELKRRHERLREEMQTKGIDVMALYCTQWKTEIVHYVSNYNTFGCCACVLLPLSGEPILFVSGTEELQRAKLFSDINDVCAINGYNLELPAAVAHRLGKRLAIAGLELMDRTQYAAFAGQFGEDNICSSWGILDKIALIKSSGEIELMRECGKIADIGVRTMVNKARLGIKEYELCAEVNADMMAAGADDNFQMTSIGHELSCIHVPGQRELKKGDFILAEITPFKESITYAVQKCVTVKAGKASKAEKDCYNMLIDALENALSIIKPGIKAKEIALVQNKIIGAFGYEKYCNPPYMRSRGHNLGLGAIELTVDNELILQPGMSMVVHPNQFIPEIGYQACGTHIVVTESGYEHLSTLPAELYEVEVTEI